MTYKIGDTVWYVDNTPKIRKDTIRGVFKEPERYTLELAGCYYYDNQFKLFPTKEALLAAIDPPLHNFTVGQDLWYVEDEDDDWGLRVEKGIVKQTTNESVTLSVANGIAIVRLDLNKYHVFDNPKEAVAKALELKQW